MCENVVFLRDNNIIRKNAEFLVFLRLLRLGKTSHFQSRTAKVDPIEKNNGEEMFLHFYDRSLLLLVLLLCKSIKKWVRTFV